MPVPQRQLSPERKATYYVGLALSILGLLLFLSTFVTFIVNFDNFDHFEEQAKSSAFRAFGGVVLLIIGGAVQNIGARGLAGGGLVADPEQARKDLEPWSRLSGGVAQDTLSEIGLVRKLEERLEAPAPEVKVRCRGCQALNDESAKFCDQCGSPL